MGFNKKLLGAPSSANAVMLISLAQDEFCVSLLLLSGGSKLEFEALLNSSKAYRMPHGRHIKEERNEAVI
jgi:hypothetical protein